jgi:hypothetical protein
LRRPRVRTPPKSVMDQGRRDSFASTLKVQRSATGSGSGRPELARPMSQLGRKPKFKIRLDGGVPIIDGRPPGADLSRGVTGAPGLAPKAWPDRGESRAQSRFAALPLIFIMHPQFSCHPMGPAHKANTGSAHPKRTTHPAPAVWRVESLRATNDSTADPNVAVIAW